MRYFSGILMAIAFITLLPTPAVGISSAEVLSPAEVVEIEPDSDGSIVVVEGEAVGDVLRARGGGSWVNILGDEVGLGIWMTAEMVERIQHLGHYKHSGDQVRVTGRLNRTCEQHDGEFDVHAHDMQVLSVGEPLTHPLRLERGLIGLVGCIIGLGLWIRYRRLRSQT